MMLRPLTVGISGDPAAHVFMGILTIEILVPDNALNYCVTVMKVSIKSREEGGKGIEELRNWVPCGFETDICFMVICLFSPS